MPLYEYYDPETGVRIELKRNVEDRNRPIVLIRSSTVPERIAIFGFGPTQEEQFNLDIMKGWYANEQAEGNNFNGAGFTKEQIKQAWSE